MRTVQPLLRSLVPLMCVLLLAGCTPFQIQELGARLPAMGPAGALQALAEYSPPERNRPQYLLDRGMLQFYLGNYAASIEDWQAAKTLLAEYQAISVSESLGAVTVNETLRSYDAAPFERVALHSFLALSYLGLGDLAGARVEVLQADVLMRQLASEDIDRGELASARFVAGVVFELNGDRDDALISYRKAHDILAAEQRWIPAALQRSLDVLQTEGANAAQASLFVFYTDGVVSTMRQHHVPIFTPELNQLVHIALPYYPPSAYRPHPLPITADAQTQHSEVIENYEQQARRDLDARMPAILAMTTARAVAKYQGVRAAQKEDEMAGLFMNLLTLATEIADTRSWRTLPASLQVARLPLTEQHSVALDTLSVDGGRPAVVITSSLNATSPTLQTF